MVGVIGAMQGGSRWDTEVARRRRNKWTFWKEKSLQVNIKLPCFDQLIYKEKRSKLNSISRLAIVNFF